MMFCAGLFLRSLHNLRSVHTGFESDSMLLMSTDQSRSRLSLDARQTAVREALARIRALPGVQAASLADITPIEGGGTMRTLAVTGTDGVTRQAPSVHLVWVSPAYFETMKIPVYSGRDFVWEESGRGTRVAVINETMSHQLFGIDSPLGATITKDGIPTRRAVRIEPTTALRGIKISGENGPSPPASSVHSHPMEHFRCGRDAGWRHRANVSRDKRRRGEGP